MLMPMKIFLALNEMRFLNNIIVIFTVSFLSSKTLVSQNISKKQAKLIVRQDSTIESIDKIRLIETDSIKYWLVTEKVDLKKERKELTWGYYRICALLLKIDYKTGKIIDRDLKILESGHICCGP